MSKLLPTATHAVSTSSMSGYHNGQNLNTKTLIAPNVGDVWSGQGGIYAGIVRHDDHQWHLLLPTRLAANFSLPIGLLSSEQSLALSAIDGLANTRKMASSKYEYPAAIATTDLCIEGHTDFYIPAIKELNLLNVNLPDFMGNGWHWSSTLLPSASAWCKEFESGFERPSFKTSQLIVRPVRRILIK